MDVRANGRYRTGRATTGIQHVILQPTPDFRTEFPDGQERITHVQASHRSGYGLIRSEWQYKTDGRIS